MRLPRLPVSRRRHEDHIDFIMRAMQARTGEVERQRDEARSERDHLAQRVADLIEERRKAGERRDELMAERDDARLRGIRVERERDEWRSERDAAVHRVAELEQAIREHRRRTRDDGWQSDTDLSLYAVLDSRGLQERGDEPVTHQDGRRYRLVKDGERSFRAVEDDVRHPRSGRFKRPLDWAARTGGSFKGVRRER